MVGAKFGVVVVLGTATQVEVATFRSDVAYQDGRRPERVVFSDARQDALRRDFTINGMFYDPFAAKVIDYVGGQADLSRAVIRAIGDPRQRFDEDHLRMLRAVRFSCTLGFALEDSTARAITALAPKIKRISSERIAEELLKILQSKGRAEGIKLTGELGLLKVISPEVDYVPAITRLAKLSGSSAPAGLACLLYGLDQTYQAKQAGDRAKAICRRLKLSNELCEQTAWLAQTARSLVVSQASSTEISLAQLKRMMAGGLFPELLRLYRTVASEHDCRQLRSRARKIDPKKVQPPPLINGKDLLAMGLRQGPRMGKCLAAIYDAQLNEQIRTKAQARKFAKDWLKSSLNKGN